MQILAPVTVSGAATVTGLLTGAYAKSSGAGNIGTGRFLGTVNNANPSGGPYEVGDFVVDSSLPGIRICTVAGSPGTWVVSAGGSSLVLSTATPQQLGTADKGNSGQASDAGHVHSNLVLAATAGAVGLAVGLTTDPVNTNYRWQTSAAGGFFWGDGSVTPDARLERSGAGEIQLYGQGAASVSRLYLGSSAQAFGAELGIRAANGQQKALSLYTAGTLRWILRTINNTETGTGNVGSDFEIASRTDAGGILASPLSIARATGIVTMAQATITSFLNVSKATDVRVYGGDGNGGTSAASVIRGENDPGAVSFLDSSPGDMILKAPYGQRVKIGAQGPTGITYASLSCDDSGVLVNTELYNPQGTSYPRGIQGFTSITTTQSTVAAGTERTIMWTSGSGGTSPQGPLNIVAGRLYVAHLNCQISRSDSQSDLAIVKVRAGSNSIAGTVLFNTFAMLGTSLVGDRFIFKFLFRGAATTAGPSGTNAPAQLAPGVQNLTVTLQKNSGTANTATMGMGSAEFWVEDIGAL